jgi:hypothetical protein
MIKHIRSMAYQPGGEYLRDSARVEMQCCGA